MTPGVIGYRKVATRSWASWKPWLKVESDQKKKRDSLRSFTRQEGGPEHAPAAIEVRKQAERGAISVADLDVAVRVTTLSFGSSQRTVYHTGQSALKKQTTQTYSE